MMSTPWYTECKSSLVLVSCTFVLHSWVPLPCLWRYNEGLAFSKFLNTSASSNWEHDDTRQLTFEIFRSTTPPKDPSPLLFCDNSYDRLS